MKQNIHLNANKMGDVKLVKERQNAALNFYPRFLFCATARQGNVGRVESMTSTFYKSKF